MIPYFAIQHDKTRDFMRDLNNLCSKYNLCLVPSYDGRKNIHDEMMAVEYTIPNAQYIGRSAVIIETKDGVETIQEKFV